jgi:hypothetical protein
MLDCNLVLANELLNIIFNFKRHNYLIYVLKRLNPGSLEKCSAKAPLLPKLVAHWGLSRVM